MGDQLAAQVGAKTEQFWKRGGADGEANYSRAGTQAEYDAQYAAIRSSGVATIAAVSTAPYIEIAAAAAWREGAQAELITRLEAAKRLVIPYVQNSKLDWVPAI